MMKTFRQWFEDKEDAVSALWTNFKIKPMHLIGMSVTFTGDVGTNQGEKSQNQVVATVEGFDDLENPQYAKLRIVNSPNHATRTYFTQQSQDGDKFDAEPVSGVMEIPMQQFTSIIMSQPWWPAMSGSGAPPGMGGGDALPGGPGL